MAARADLSPHCAPEGHCITCGDEAAPMRVISIDVADRLALCEDAAGAPVTIQTDLVEGLDEGDTVLAHAGVALVRLEGQGA